MTRGCQREKGPLERENVTPITESSALASIAMRRIASVDFSTGIHLTVTGTDSPS